MGVRAAPLSPSGARRGALARSRARARRAPRTRRARHGGAGSVIDKRKASGEKGDDILQVFIDARYKDGTALTNDEITGLLITLLFAGQHTSSITGTWLGMNIVGYGYLDAVYQEQKAARAANNGELNYDALMSMSLMRNCISETLRCARATARAEARAPSPARARGVDVLTRARARALALARPARAGCTRHSSS